MSQRLTEQLYQAFTSGDNELASQIAKTGVDLDYFSKKDPNKYTLLYLAIKNNLSLEAFASITDLNKDRTSIAHENFLRTILLASYDEQDKSEYIQQLLSRRPWANLNEYSFNDGGTSLHAAVERGHINLVKLLCHYAASAALMNLNGKSALELAIDAQRFDIVDAILQNTSSEKSKFTPEQLKNLQKQLKNHPKSLKLLRVMFKIPDHTRILQAGLFAFGALMIPIGFIIAFLPFPVIPQLAGWGFINIGMGALTGGLGGALAVSAYFVNPSFDTTKELVAEEELSIEKAEDKPREKREKEQSRAEIEKVVTVVQTSTFVDQQESSTDAQQDRFKQDLVEQGFTEEQIKDVMELMQSEDTEKPNIPNIPKTTSSKKLEPEESEIQTPNIDRFRLKTDQQMEKFIAQCLEDIPKNRRGKEEVDSLISALQEHLFQEEQEDNTSRISFFSKDTSDVQKTKTKEEQVFRV